MHAKKIVSILLIDQLTLLILVIKLIFDINLKIFNMYGIYIILGIKTFGF
jgi:hypothetical protein